MTEQHASTPRRAKPTQRRPDDSELVARFEREVVPLRESLYRHALRLCRNHLDAEDLTQETMLKAYKGFHSFQPGSNLNAWMFRILSNVHINAYRKKRAQVEQCFTEELTDQQLSAAYARCTPQELRSAEDVALDSLPDNDSGFAAVSGRSRVPGRRESVTTTPSQRAHVLSWSSRSSPTRSGGRQALVADTFVVIGDTTVARRVCSSLAQRGHEVRHIPGPDDDELRETLDGTSVRGIAILLQDDVDALRYALAAAHIHPSAPMMVTIFDRTIGDQLARFLPQCDVTSPADLAAPSLAGPCVQPGLLAVTRADDLPRGIRTAGAVLDEVPVTVRARRGWPTWPMQVAGLWRSHETGTRILVAGLLGLAAVLVGDWVWLTVGEGQGAADAFHEAVRVVTTVGPAADPHGNTPYSLVASTAMLMTIVFTAMFTAGIVDRLLGPRLSALIGARALPRSGHVIVVGLGQVGLRLCRELRALGIPVVGVERDTHARNLRLVRELNIPAVVGHGGDGALLERIGIHRAIALAAVGSDDRDNIAVSLAAQGIAPGLRLVLRAGEREVLAETGSLLPLGVTRDVTSLSATYVLARLLGLDPLGVVAGEAHVHVRLAGGGFEEIPIASPGGCRHADTGGVQRPAQSTSHRSRG